MMVDVKNINKSRIQKVSAMHHGGGATLWAKKQNSKDYELSGPISSTSISCL